MTTTAIPYDLHGDLIEACSCMGPCPCWVGDDPDGGYCNSFTGYHFRSGTARGVDVSGITSVSLVQIPGNVADGNWSEVMFVSDNATDEPRPSQTVVSRGSVTTLRTEGLTVTPFYDPLLAKIVAHGSDRAAAVARLDQALADTTVDLVGPTGNPAATNLSFLRKVLAAEAFTAGRYDTSFAEALAKG